jgi:hypothetical protein
MNRREFLAMAGVGAFHRLGLSKFNSALRSGTPMIALPAQSEESKAISHDCVNCMLMLLAYSERTKATDL